MTMKQVHAEVNVRVFVKSSTKLRNRSVRFLHCRIYSTDNCSASESDAEAPIFIRGVSGKAQAGLHTDQLPGHVLVRPRLLGVFVQVHHRPPNAAVLQGLLAHTGQLQRRQSQKTAINSVWTLMVSLHFAKRPKLTFHLNQLEKKCFQSPTRNCLRYQTTKSRNLP